MKTLRRKPLLALGLSVVVVVAVVAVSALVAADAVPWDCCGWMKPGPEGFVLLS